MTVHLPGRVPGVVYDHPPAVGMGPVCLRCGRAVIDHGTAVGRFLWRRSRR